MSNNQTTIPSLGWALIGCGGAGNRHTQWAMSTPGVEIHGFCDKLIGSAERFHQKYGGSYYTTDPERIFTDSSIDIVSIATSHHSHADLAVAACNARKHLFLEKPMAMTTSDSSIIGFLYLNSEAYSTSTGTLAISSKRYSPTKPACQEVPQAMIMILF